MTDKSWWSKRLNQLGKYSIGPDDTQTDQDLEKHLEVFVTDSKKWLEKLEGPTLDFGCGIGRWIDHLPKPYFGMDLMQEHLDIFKENKNLGENDKLVLASKIDKLKDNSFNSIFTCTVLQHIVSDKEREDILSHFQRILTHNGQFLSIEWSTNQWENEWCIGVPENLYKKFFDVMKVGNITESKRIHTIWLCKKNDGKN